MPDYGSYMCSLIKIKTGKINESTDTTPPHPPTLRARTELLLTVWTYLQESYNCSQFIGEEADNSKNLSAGSLSQS